MDVPRDCCTEWSKSDRERQISYVISCTWNLWKKGTNEPIYKTEIESLMLKTNLWLSGGKDAGEG